MFLKASQSGDRATVAECFAAIAGSFSDLRAVQPIGGNLQEGWVKRGEQAGVVHFIRTSRGRQMLELP